MIRILWKYRVKPGQEEVFIKEYGTTGPWAKFFTGKPGFLGTELIRSADGNGDFVTIDTWESKSLYAACLRDHAAEYREIDARGQGLTDAETKIGEYELLSGKSSFQQKTPIETNSQTRNIFVYVFDTMADWESAYLLPELNTGRFFRKDAPKIRIFTVGLDRRPITTMGGLRILPDVSLSETQVDQMAALVLPGGIPGSIPFTSLSSGVLPSAFNKESWLVRSAGRQWPSRHEGSSIRGDIRAMILVSSNKPVRTMPEKPTT